jgi:UDP-N-acetylglucosamine acyltransferase
VKIHPTAIVHPGAEIDEGVEIGPFSIIGPNVRIGRNTVVMSSVVVEGWTTVGSENVIFPNAVLGTAPQDLSYRGQRAYVRIGDRNEVREGVTVHRAADEDGVTSVGDDNLLMACAHVAHNCHIGNQVVMANYAGLAGHAVVEDQAILGGLSGVHQFVRIGRLCMVGGLAKITKDLPPFAIVDGNPARIYGLNSRGLRRRGVAESARLALKRSFRLLTMAGLNLEQALAAIRSSQLDCPEVAHLVDFLEAPTRMGVLTRSCGDRRQKCAEVLEPDPRDSDRGAC